MEYTIFPQNAALHEMLVHLYTGLDYLNQSFRLIELQII